MEKVDPAAAPDQFEVPRFVRQRPVQRQTEHFDRPGRSWDIASEVYGQTSLVHG